MAAGALCVAVQNKLNIPVITAMAAENPGADLYREFMYIVDSGDNGAKMRDVLARMAALAQKLLRGESIGSPRVEGYLSARFDPRSVCRAHGRRAASRHGV